VNHPLSDAALNQLFLDAHTHNRWLERTVDEALLRRIYELFKWGPTSANASPGRYVWVRSEEGKAKLSALSSAGNKAKILQAPVTVIIGYDLDYPAVLPRLFPSKGEAMKANLQQQPALVEVTAMRNSSLQGAYLIVAARALGLDCGPMSGFDNEAVDREFFAGTRIKSNFICSLGVGDPASVHPRNARLSFEEAGRFA
jgi:3-hydroxypropanoate dehydrogenase